MSRSLPRIALLSCCGLLAATGCDQIVSLIDGPGGAKPPTASIQVDSPRSVLDRAIAACGGEQNIDRLQRGRVEIVGRGGFAPGVSGQFTIVDTFDLPSRLRRKRPAATASWS